MGKPVHSPWGAIQSADEIAPGIWDVSTAGHGGIKLEAALNKKVPEYMRRPNGWYEEDIDWTVVATVFPEHFSEKQRRVAEYIFLDWRPDMYEQFYHVKLEEGSSRVRDQKVFHDRNKNNLIARSAFGDWHPQVPEGHVVLFATRGDANPNDPETESGYFLVPADEYERKPWTGFVVYPAKHVELADFDPNVR